jgi:type IV pilus assembly protein PilM
MARRSLLGLDIGSKFVKCVEMTESSGQYQISGIAVREIPSADGVKDVIRDLLAEAKFRTRRVISSVSGRSIIVRYITMPYMSDTEMRNAIKYEAAKYIPFEVEDMILDYQRLKDEGGAEGAEKSKEMRVLLVAAKREFITEHANTVEELGLLPAVVDVDSFALGNGFELAGTIRTDAFDWTKITALVDIGAAKTNVNIVKGDVSYFTREIFIGGDEMTESLSKKANLDLPEAETIKRDPGAQQDRVEEAVSSVLEDLCHEIHLSLDYFENQFDRPVDDILASGGGSRAPGLDGAFEKAFGRKPVRWSPVEHVEIDRDRVDPTVLNTYSSQLAVAVGLAARIRMV